MNAETHLEVYRPFLGKLREHPVRFVPLWTSGLATALKQRRALFVLYLPPLIATVIVSFLVYTKYAVEPVLSSPDLEASGGLEQALVRKAVMSAQSWLEIKQLLLDFTRVMGGFALLAVTWFASGLVCEDRKAGAHQLYFARPLTRFDYALGKFMVAATFAALAMLAPVLIILLMATVFSPDWSFATQEWDVYLRAIGFVLLWIFIVCSLVLCASSIASRRTFALLGVFGFVMLSAPVGGMLGDLVDHRWLAIALLADLETLSLHFFGIVDDSTKLPTGAAWAAVGAFVVVSWTIIWMRLRRLEVVA